MNFLTKQKNHAIRTALVLFICVIVLMMLAVFASNSNTKKYYLAERDGALEIWQGRFAPAAKKQLLTLPGIQLPAPHKPVYTRDEVYPLAFHYYINKADMILEVPGVPDFEAIKSYLNKALAFAVTDEQQKCALSRLYGIDIMILLYKTDVSTSKGTITDLKAALSYLQQAKALDISGQHTHIINPKLESINSSIKQLQEKDSS